MTRAEKIGLTAVVTALVVVVVIGAVLYHTDRTFRIVFDPMLTPFNGEPSVQVWCNGAISFALNMPKAVVVYATYKYYDHLLKENGIDGRG
jgi:hypothetical protein